MTIKVVTFDLDNTLWDVDPVISKAEQAQYRWLQQYRAQVTDKFDMDEVRNHKNAFHKNNPRYNHQISKLRIAALKAIQIEAGYSDDLAEQGAQQAFAEFMNFRHQVTFYEKALEVLEILAEKYILGALTNGNADINKMDARDYFDFAYSAEQVNASKPHPAIFEAALDKCRVKASEVVHVGDNPEHDVMGAQAVGMYTVWMNYNHSVWPGGPAPHREIHDLQCLPATIEEISAALS